MKTFSLKAQDITRSWYVIDASEAPMGRIATKAATLLTGKGKTEFSKHLDCGDYVIITNASKVVATGKKMTDKIYYRHSGYPSGLTETSLKHSLEKDATKAITHAIRGMLPVNKLRDGRLARLKVYVGEEHQHEAQKPKVLSLKKEGK